MWNTRIYHNPSITELAPEGIEGLEELCVYKRDVCVTKERGDINVDGWQSTI